MGDVPPLSRASNHIDTAHKQVTGHEAWYVALTRAKSALTVYTDSREKLPEVIGQVLAKESAIEAVEKNLGKGRGMGARH